MNSSRTLKPAVAVPAARFVYGVAISIAVILLLGPTSAQAANAQWTGATDGNWSSVGNWSATPVPGTGNTATFASTNNGHTTISLGAGVTINTLNFDTTLGAIYTIGAGAVGSQTLTINHGGFIQLVSTANDQLINAAVTLGTNANTGAYIFGSFAFGSTLTFVAPITGGTGGTAGTKTFTLMTSTGATTVINGAIGGGGGTIAVTKSSGAGTLALNGTNTFTGALAIDQGTLSVATINNASTAGPLGNSALPVTLSNGSAATLQYTGATASSNKRFTVLNLGSFQIDSTATELTLSGVIDGSGGVLRKTGPGTLTLTGANTYSGQTSVSGGVLKVSGAGKLGAATAFLQVDATLDLGGTSQTVAALNGNGNGLIVNNGGGASVLTTSSAFDGLFNGTIADNNNATAGTVAVTKDGTGYLTLNGANTYSGATLVSDGVLTVAVLGNTVGATTVASGASLRLVADSAEAIAISGPGFQGTSSVTAALEGGDINYSGLLALGASASILTYGGPGAPFAITNPGTILGPGRTLTLDSFGAGTEGSIASIIGTTTGGVIVAGGGKWTLTGVNTFTGAVSVTENSTLAVATVNNASTAGPLGNSATAVTLNASTLEYTGATASSTKPFALVTSGTFQIDSAATDLTLSGVISGVGDALIKTGAGTLTLTAANTYSGGTTIIYPGTLKLSGSGKLGATTGGLFLQNGKLDLGGTDQTVGSLLGYGTIVNNGGGSSVLTVNTSATDNVLNNFIFDNDNATAGTVGLTKSGTGTLMLGLGGTSNYSGLVQVLNGILVANSFDALGSAATGTIVSSGATLRLQVANIAAEPIEISGVGETGTDGALEGSAATYGGLLKLNAASTIASILALPEYSFDLTNPGTITGAGFTLTLAGVGTGSIASIIGTTTGGITKTDTGKWTLTGANTYTGTTTISAGILNIQNTNALGASISNDTTITSGATLQIEGGITTPAAEGVTVRGVGAAGTTGAFQNVAGINNWAGPVILGADSTISSDAGMFNITNTGTIYGTTTGFDLTLAGAGNGSLASIWNGGISSAVGAGTLIKTGSGKWTLTGLSTYTGKTFIRDGTLEINTLKNVSGGSSSLGAPTTAANGTIDMGSTTTTGALKFTGSADASSNRVINLAGTTGGATLDSSSATNNKLVFTSAFTATGLGDKVLTLTGMSTGDNEISAAIVNSTGFKTSVTKTGGGNWKLSGTSTYTGNTSVSAGTLTITNAFLANAADVNLTTGATLNLTFAGSDTINQLRIDGVVQSAGTWGGLASSATFKTALIAGTGILSVTSGPAQQPYASWAATFPLSGASYPFDANADGDALPNGFEWILGSNPLGINTGSRFLFYSDATNIYLDLNRIDASESSALTAQWSTDLAGWTDVPIGATSSGPDVNGVSINVIENGAAADTVVVTFPKSLGTQGRLFARWKASMP